MPCGPRIGTSRAREFEQGLPPRSEWQPCASQPGGSENERETEPQEDEFAFEDPPSAARRILNPSSCAPQPNFKSEGVLSPPQNFKNARQFKQTQHACPPRAPGSPALATGTCARSSSSGPGERGRSSGIRAGEKGGSPVRMYGSSGDRDIRSPGDQEIGSPGAGRIAGRLGESRKSPGKATGESGRSPGKVTGESGRSPGKEPGESGRSPGRSNSQVRVAPPATIQLLAVLGHAVRDASVVNADEAEISSDDDDDEELAERHRPPAHRRTASCDLHEVEPAVRAALGGAFLGGSLGGSPEAAVELLLELGADVDALDADRNCPLYLAVHLPAEAHALEVSRKLLNRSAHANERRRGLTPLNYAMRRGHAQLVKLLLAHGGYALRWADEPPPHLKDLKRRAGPGPGVLAIGGNGGKKAAIVLSCPTLCTFSKANAFWPLALKAMLDRLNEAVSEGSVVVIEGLLAHGCPSDERDAYGRTPLFRAVARQQRPAVLGALLRGGAQPDVRDSCGTHILAAPIIRNDSNTVRVLLKFRADPLAEEEGVRLDAFATQVRVRETHPSHLRIYLQSSSSSSIDCRTKGNSTSSAVHALLARCTAYALAERQRAGGGGGGGSGGNGGGGNSDGGDGGGGGGSSSGLRPTYSSAAPAYAPASTPQSVAAGAARQRSFGKAPDAAAGQPRRLLAPAAPSPPAFSRPPEPEDDSVFDF